MKTLCGLVVICVIFWAVGKTMSKDLREFEGVLLILMALILQALVGF
ncbi:hypothetical protein LG200_05235 [Methylobacillus caricis]|nr:hypothetical protein [Methylobacillus caricis]MCB5187408.1 hypothetical protein [Methylobacillus caricis]